MIIVKLATVAPSQRAPACVRPLAGPSRARGRGRGRPPIGGRLAQLRALLGPNGRPNEINNNNNDKSSAPRARSLLTCYLHLIGFHLFRKLIPWARRLAKICRTPLRLCTI